MAMAQTREFICTLATRYPGLEVEARIVKTTGDMVRDRPLSSLGGYGAFVKELDNNLLDGEVDVVVNSLKDMPVDLTPGTEISAILPRGPVEDVLLPDVDIDELPKGARVGTSSVRRKALLLNARPDLEVLDIRGNVPTRIRKLKEGEYEAIMLARAGLERLGLGEPNRVLDPVTFVPAPGQGAIAIVCRENDDFARMVRAIDHPRTRMEVLSERSVLRGVGGGCSVPIGIWVNVEPSSVSLRGVVLSPDGRRCLRVEEELPIAEIGRGLDSMGERLMLGLEEW